MVPLGFGLGSFPLAAGAVLQDDVVMSRRSRRLVRQGAPSVGASGVTLPLPLEESIGYPRSAVYTALSRVLAGFPGVRGRVAPLAGSELARSVLRARVALSRNYGRIPRLGGKGLSQLYGM